MASAIKSALPSHLKVSPLSSNGDGNDDQFQARHHGKTRSHMVSMPGFILARFFPQNKFESWVARASRP